MTRELDRWTAWTAFPLCAKCLSKESDLRFCVLHHPARYGMGVDQILTAAPEHLDVTCRQCGYAWGMETADRKAKPEPSE